MKRIVTAFLFILASSLPALGQATTSAALAPPSLPLMPRYQYWPQQYVLFPGPELPYSQAFFYADSSRKTPVYDLVLVERNGGRRINYSNDDQVVKYETAAGNEAHKAAIRYDSGDSENAGNVSSVLLTLADGKPLIWRFVQGTDVSERGSGVVPTPELPMPVLSYREQGALAGEGSALQIGNTVSQIGEWTEMSQPPYMIAYHGAYTKSSHRLVFVPGEQQWKVVSAPTKIEVSQAWELTSTKQLHRTLRIQSVSGTSVVLNGTDENNEQMSFRVNATYSGGNWAIESIRFAPVKDGEKHFVDLRFSPSFAAQANAVDMEVVAGKRTRIATGTLTVTGPTTDRLAVLTFKKPDWISTKSVTVETKSPATVTDQASKL